MIADVARLTRWEWFKLRRRWMPWILLALMVLFSQIGIWGSYFDFRQTSSGGSVTVGSARIGEQPRSVSCADVLAGPPALPSDISAELVPALRAQCDAIAGRSVDRLSEIYADLALPGSIDHALSTASTISVILVAVLVASTIGVEYGWGTMRTTLVRGTGRWQYFAGKTAVLLIAALGAVLVVAVGAAVSSLIIGVLESPPPGFVAGGWDTGLAAVGRAWYGIMPMVALVALLTVLTSSTATAMAAGIGYTIAEPLVVALLGQVSDRLRGVSDYLLASSIDDWNGAQGFGNATSTVGSLHQFVVLAVYTAVFLSMAIWLLQSRDVTKATGT